MSAGRVCWDCGEPYPEGVPDNPSYDEDDGSADYYVCTVCGSTLSEPADGGEEST